MRQVKDEQRKRYRLAYRVIDDLKTLEAHRLSKGHPENLCFDSRDEDATPSRGDYEPIPEFRVWPLSTFFSTEKLWKPLQQPGKLFSESRSVSFSFKMDATLSGWKKL